MERDYTSRMVSTAYANSNGVNNSVNIGINTAVNRRSNTPSTLAGLGKM